MTSRTRVAKQPLAGAPQRRVAKPALPAKAEVASPGPALDPEASDPSGSEVNAIPPGWPEQFMPPEQSREAFRADGASEAVISTATKRLSGLRKDIEVLAGALLAAAQVLAAAPIADQATAQAAVRVFAEEYDAAIRLAAGARRKGLFAIREAMVDLAVWLHCAAAESDVVRLAANDNGGDTYGCLVIVRQAGRLLADLSPDATRRLRYVSLFSGMEACSAALERIGAEAEPVAFADIDPAASAVLAHKWPRVINAGDVSKFAWEQFHGEVDIVAGGSPCQAFSVAGRRLGLDDPRGNLAIHFLKVIDAVKPRWFLYENVPGLLSSGGGEDFQAFLELAGESGYSCCWRVLDAKHFGVAQRRRRVFVVGYLGTAWEPPATVLLEPESPGGGSLACRKAWQAAPRRAEGSASVGLTRRAAAVANGSPNAGACLEPKIDVADVLRTAGAGSSYPAVVYAADMRQGSVSTKETMTLQVGHKTQGYSLNTIPCALYEQRDESAGESATWIVRRFTPRETLRLQGFDDDWLDGVAIRGKPLSDSHRYKLIGNSWAVPVAAWILDRIIGWDELAGHVPTMEQREDAERLLHTHGFEVFDTRDDGIAGFAPGASLGLLLDGWDARGALFRVIDKDGVTDTTRFLKHPVIMEAAVRQLSSEPPIIVAQSQVPGSTLAITQMAAPVVALNINI